MGFISPTPQPVKPAEFLQLPFLERIRILSQRWAVDGFGTPRMLHVVYILKMFGLYFGAGIGIAIGDAVRRTLGVAVRVRLPAPSALW